jgi:hypothetical protein
MQATEEFLTEWAAAEQAGDAGALELLLADGFTAVGPLGFTQPKQAWLARHRSPTRTSASMRSRSGRPARMPR